MFKKLQQQLAAKREAGKAGPLTGKQLSVGSRVVKVDRLLGEGEWGRRWGRGQRRPPPPPLPLPTNLLPALPSLLACYQCPLPCHPLCAQAASPPSTAAPMSRAARRLPSNTSS